MIKLLGGAQIVDWGFLTELLAANTHPTRLGDRTEYIGRKRKVKQKANKNSNFLIGLYGSNWGATYNFVRDWV